MLRKFALSCVILAAVSSVVQARPRDCYQGRNAQIYQEAYHNRYKEMTSEWKKRYRADCSYQVDFELRYDTNFSESGPAIRICKNAGLNDATHKVFNEISRKCTAQGKRYGAEDGYQFGKEYCGGAKIAYSSGDFEYAYEESCRNAFTRWVNYFCPSKKNKDKNFANTVKKQCNI